MSTDGARCDKITFNLQMEYDRFTTWYASFKEYAAGLAAVASCDVNISCRCRAHDTSTGLRTYEVDTWGKFSDVLLKSLPETLLTKVSRLDWRVEKDVNPDNLPRLDLFVRNHGKGNRNTNLFSSRERVKKEGRHGGGHGWALGSHKSDTRLVVYKKKGERGAIELNLSGAALRNTIQTASGLTEKGAFASVYDALMATMELKSDALIQKMGFASLAQLGEYVADEAPAMGVPSQGHLSPDTIKSMAAALRECSPSERALIFRQLGARASDMALLFKTGSAASDMADTQEGA